MCGYRLSGDSIAPIICCFALSMNRSHSGSALGCWLGRLDGFGGLVASAGVALTEEAVVDLLRHDGSSPGFHLSRVGIAISECRWLS